AIKWQQADQRITAARNDILGRPHVCRSVMGCRIIGFPVSGSTPPLGLVALRGQEQDVAEAIAASLKARGDWDLLLLHQMDLERPPSKALATALERAGTLSLREAGSTFVIDTQEGGFEDFMAGLQRRFRKEVERWSRRHEDLGEIKFVNCPADISLEDAMKVVGEILENSWKTAENNADTLHRLAELAQAGLDEGKLDLVIKMVDDRPTSYLLSFLHENKLFTFHIAYDLQLNQIGPGQVQLKEAVRRSCNGDTTMIDLGGGFSYLRKWSSGTRDFHEVRVIHKGIRSRVIASAYLQKKDARQAKARETLEQVKQSRKEEAKAKGGDEP
ncbi:MAG: GNAT family N-acetyltransferase, partial [Pseudomonadota bacterium]